MRRAVRAARRRLAPHDLMLLAAGLTFYAAIAVVPLFLVMVFLASRIAGEGAVRDMGLMLSSLAPEELGFAENLRVLLDAGIGLKPLAVVAAVVVATTYGEGLTRVLDRVADHVRPRKGLRGRVRALALLAILPLLGLGGLLVGTRVPDLVGFGRGLGPALLGVYLSFWVLWIACTLLLAVTYRAFTAVPLPTPGLLVGAAAAGSFLAGMSMGWLVLLDFGIEVGRAYGGSEELGAVVLFVLYLFLVQIVSVVGYALALSVGERAADG